MKLVHLLPLVLVIPAICSAQNTFPASGNVGIGTTSPGQRLTIVNTSAGDGIWMASNSTSDLALLTNMGVGAWNPLTQAGDSLILFRGSAPDSTDSGGLVIGSWSSSNKGIRIDTNGNVGIGTTTPGAKLDVVGNIKMSGGRSVILFRGDNSTTHVGGLQMVTFDNGVHTILTPTDQNATPIDSTIRLGGFGNFNSNTVNLGVSGNVGIGTVSPAAPLDVNGGAIVRGLTGTNGGALSIFGAPSLEGGQINLMDAGATVATQTSQWSIDNFAGNLRFFRGNSSPPQMTLTAAGNLGIGGDPGTYKLAVNGTIHTKEVVVDTNGWSDYVFKPGYRLAPLSEVQATIQQEGHLPGIPSAQEVAEHGVSVGEMQAKLLAKIEELTLHQIEQEKRLSAQSVQLAAQSAQLAAQSDRIERLETENTQLKSQK